MSQPVKKNAGSNIVQETPYLRWLRRLELDADFAEPGQAGQDIAARVAEAMLEADTLEAAFAAQDSTIPSGKDMVDVEMQVKDFVVCKSDTSKFEHGLPVYLRVEAVRLDNAEPITFATGAPNIVTLLWKAKELVALPLDCRISSKPTANGELLTLRLIPKRAI